MSAIDDKKAKVGVNMIAMGDYVRSKLGLPEGWEVYAFNTKHRMSKTDALVEVRGCVPTTFKRGPRKGKKKYEGGTEDLTTHIVVSDVERWLLEREEKQGICARCYGSNEEWIGWSRDGGTKTVPCRRCQTADAERAGKEWKP